MNSPSELSGAGMAATYPLGVVHLLPGSAFSGNKAWGMLTQLSKRAKNGFGMSAAFGFSTDGPSYFQILPGYSFTGTSTETGELRLVDANFYPAVFNEISSGVQSRILSLGTDAARVAEGADSLLNGILDLN
jgi:hypothetical protein